MDKRATRCPEFIAFLSYIEITMIFHLVRVGQAKVAKRLPFTEGKSLFAGKLQGDHKI